MGRIAVLPEVVKNQIAAGEVIERPASVVKELTENAIDAGATQIRVDLEGGGVGLVRVVDDGVGMDAEDLALAFEGHATSKLSEPSDLEHIASLGFRGEALASMGSVARCRILSRPTDATVGATVVAEGGRVQDVLEAGGPRGTTLEVRDLFYNIPARRQFLKRTSTELARCVDVVQRLALAHDGIGFVMTSDGKRVFDVEPGMDFLGRIRRTFGAELADHLMPVEAASNGMRLSGFVAPPRFARRDTARQMWFLNGRMLRDKLLIRVLKDAYHGFIEHGRQPVAFLRLSLDPARVDVNVHPAKAEVRFRDSRPIFGFLVKALRAAVVETDMATPGESLMETRARREAREAELRTEYLPLPSTPSRGGQDPIVVREVSGRPLHETPVQGGATFGAPESTVAQFRPKGAEEVVGMEWGTVDGFQGPFIQVDRTYIVRGLPDGFEIIDQHALHERLTYELMRQDVRENSVAVQRLLIPETVDCSRADVGLLMGHQEALERIGIVIEAFGEATLAVHGLPSRLKNPDAEGVVRDLIEILGRDGKLPDAEDVIEEVLHSAACRSSIMAGDELRESDIQSLLQRAAQLESDQTCPHSRPTRVRFTLADLEKA
ncbi:MAG: DNA mismatch repair endonuclease MutL, partial [Planctomycetes bacterium]|nr:DNA mismatch repair endonuclease MutL [Planctomycetota bacterium]